MSLDGAWIVYSSSNAAAPGIWKVRPDGRDATLLLAGAYTLPELAPQSGWISAVETSSGNLRTIRIVVSAGWADSDILLAEGIPGIGAALRTREP
jgi:Tol biopolymer transport system component